MLNFERRFSPNKIALHDGAWIVSIALVAFLMLVNDAAWSIVGMALVYLLMALHVLLQHKNLYGDRDLLGPRLMMGGAWLVSLIFVVVMPVVALVNYGIYARDIRRKFSNREYRTAWTAYMRILGVTVAALMIYVFKIYISVPTFEAP